MPGPLAGLSVLDFSWGMPGGLAGAVLADFGAEVVKIEPPAGDPFRVHPAWLSWNRGKQSVVLDLEREDGRAQAQRLAEGVDVVLESFRPGEAARLGIDYATLSARNPRLVYASISGWGQQGPLAQYPAYEGAVAARSASGRSPRPMSRADAIAAASVTRIISRARSCSTIVYPLIGSVRRDRITEPCIHQCLKCRLPVNTIARWCRSATSIAISSRTDPPGWMMAVTPACAAIWMPSGNGK